MTVTHRARAVRARDALRLEGVTRVFGPTLALAPVTLRMAQGSVCVVEGANGSGKTTLLRVAAGLTSPSGGRRSAAAPALDSPRRSRPGSG